MLVGGIGKRDKEGKEKAKEMIKTYREESRP